MQFGKSSRNRIFAQCIAYIIIFLPVSKKALGVIFDCTFLSSPVRGLTLPLDFYMFQAIEAAVT